MTFRESIVIDRAAADRMTWEELEAAGLCDCGRSLDNHPPVPKPKPLGGWESALEGQQPWRNTLSNKAYTPAQRASHRNKKARNPRPGSRFQIGRSRNAGKLRGRPIG